VAIQIVMDNSGDSRFEVYPSDTAAVAKAMERFEELTGRGYTAAERIWSRGVAQGDGVRSDRDRGPVHAAGGGWVNAPPVTPADGIWKWQRRDYGFVNARDNSSGSKPTRFDAAARGRRECFARAGGGARFRTYGRL
jgi:hypothetical protein